MRWRGAPVLVPRCVPTFIRSDPLCVNSPKAMRGTHRTPKALPAVAGSARFAGDVSPYSLTGADAALGVPWVSESALVWDWAEV